MNRLKFSFNWNNKLSCGSFTSIRMWNPEKYRIGNTLHVVLTKKDGTVKTDYGDAVIADIRRIKLDQINEFVARLDTGYDAERCKDLLRTMYKNKRIDWTRQELVYLLLVKVGTQPEQTNLF